MNDPSELTAGAVRNDVSVVVVTYNGLPWIECCLESVAGLETVVVDHGSTDGTVDVITERFPAVRLLERENRGLAAGWNSGLAATTGTYVLIMNSDAWVVDDAIEHLAATADAHPRAAFIGPQLRNPDGTLQPSVRGFPTVWRLATEYLFLRWLAPRSRTLNAFYGAGFDHDRLFEAEFLMAACFLLRREAAAEVGPADESFFLFSEEVDWCYRFHQAGWQVLFTPTARAVHVGGASHGGRLFAENLRGHLRFLRKHRGEREAERARRLLVAALRVRSVLFRGERGRMYRQAARLLGSGTVDSLLRASQSGGVDIS